MKFVLLSLIAIIPLSAQIHLGFKGGVPFGSVTETYSSLTSNPSLKSLPSYWTFGPMAELDLPAGIGLEANILYRRIGYEATVAGATAKSTGGLLDFPLLVKYRFPGVAIRPYISGGFTYRRLNDLIKLNSNTNGFVLGAGLRIPALLVKISPELRYTRWADAPTSGNTAFRARRNQAEVLVGLTF